MNESVQKMPQSEQDELKGVSGLAGEFGKLSTAFAPQVFKVFSDFLNIANNLLPVVTPFATTFADALDKMLKKVGQFTQSKGFQDWIGQFHSLEGPALNSIGDGIGKVAIAIGKLLTTMSGKDVANAISIAFGVIAGAIDVVRVVVSGTMKAWDSLVKTFDEDRHKIAHDFDTVRHAIATFGHDVAHDFDTVRHAAATLGHWIATHFDQMRHDIAHWADVVRQRADDVVT